jgi:Ferritin-like
MRPKIRRHLGLLFEEAKPEKLLAPAAGRQPCPVPVEFTPHRYAVFLLHVAAEIEHALMVQYLYAAFSLGGSKVPTDRLIEVSQWREIILGIAKEEMGHLMTVQNVLRCLGGPLNLDREDFPWDSEFYPFPFKLEPLTLQSLAKYVFAESPADWSGAEADQVRTLAQQGVGNAPINHVGNLYKTIADLLEDKTLIKDADFRGSTFPYQANWDEWGRGYKAGERGNSTKAAMAGTPDVLLMPVVAKTDSLAALRKIADQGEANPAADDNAPSHFTRFLRIYRNFPTTGSWSPSRPVPVDPIVLSEGQGDEAGGDWGGTPITHPESKLWAHLFNIRYEALLTNLLHTFEYPNNVTDVSQTTPRGLLLHSTFGEMYNIRALSELLVQMPLAPDNSELLAGPPFQIPYTLKLAVDAVDRWRTHLDLLQVSLALADRLLAVPNQRHAAYLRSLREADRQFIAMIEQILRRPSAAQPAVKQYS